MNHNFSATPSADEVARGPEQLASLSLASQSLATLWKVERDITTTEHRAVEGRAVPLAAPIRWALGVMVGATGLAALTVVASDRIESELEDRTESSLAEAGLDPADFDIDFDVRNGTVTGTLPNGWSGERFLAEIHVDGARRLVFVPGPSIAAEDPDS